MLLVLGILLTGDAVDSSSDAAPGVLVGLVVLGTGVILARSGVLRIARRQVVGPFGKRMPLSQVQGVAVGRVSQRRWPIARYCPVLVNQESGLRWPLRPLASCFWQSRPPKGLVDRTRNFAKLIEVPYLKDTDDLE